MLGDDAIEFIPQMKASRKHVDSAANIILSLDNISLQYQVNMGERWESIPEASGTEHLKDINPQSEWSLQIFAEIPMKFSQY